MLAADIIKSENSTGEFSLHFYYGFHGKRNDVDIVYFGENVSGDGRF